MFTVTACGHDSHHPKPCNIEHRPPLKEYLMLLVKSEAWFELDGDMIQVHPGMIILFAPGEQIHYGCPQRGYNDDWIHFTADDADEVSLRTLEIPTSVPLYPQDFYRLSQYVSLLSSAFHRGSRHQNELTDSLLRSLLIDFAEMIHQTAVVSDGKYYAPLSALRTSIYNDPSQRRSVASLADSVHLSISYFQHLYKDYFGCTCQEDMILARLELAKLYLSDSEMTVREIADFSGYENELHFMRQFKKFVGMTPSQYRQLPE